MRVELFNFVKRILETEKHFTGTAPTMSKVEAQFSMLIIVAPSFKLNNEYDE
jgi:hypothetical protein